MQVKWLSCKAYLSLSGKLTIADINGDGRAEYLQVTRSGSGAVNEWLNGGGSNNGPNAAQVVWYPQGQIATGDGTSGANVLFAGMYLLPSLHFLKSTSQLCNFQS